jgi:hypothetical protein
LGLQFRDRLDGAARVSVEAAPMNETSLTLILEVEAHGDHIAGCVTGPVGTRRAFVGRIGLMCAIDTLVAEGTDADVTATPPPTNTNHKEPQ